MSNKSNEILRIHVDASGIVWCGHSGVCCFCAHKTLEEFLRSEIFTDARHIKLLGVPSNAKLLCRAYDLKLRQPGDSENKIEIGSPACCFRKTFIEDPCFVLQQIWQPATAVTSHWHSMTQHDYTSYLAIVSLREDVGRVGDKLKAAIRYHPAWVALTFPLTCDIEYGCRLVCDIVDPRWYTHLERPNRSSNLMTHLGVTYRNLVATYHNLARQELPAALSAWKAGPLTNVVRAWAGQAAKVDHSDPRNFLWRISQQAGGGSTGLLKASRVFVRFVRWNWLQELAMPGRTVFCHKRFFKTEAEREAYRTHVGSIRP